MVKKIRTSLEFNGPLHGNVDVMKYTVQEESLSADEHGGNPNRSSSLQTKQTGMPSFLRPAYIQTDSWNDPADMPGVF